MKKLRSVLKIEKIDSLILLILVFVSFLIRFVPIYRGDFPFLFDQGRDMLAVYDIVVKHHFTLLGPFTGLQGVFQGPLHYYLLAIPFVLTHGDPRAAVYMMAIVYLIGIICAYYLGKNMINHYFGLVLAFFIAIAPASIASSSYEWNPNWIPFLMIFYMYFLYKGIFSDKKLFPFAALVAGLVAQFELPFGVILFVASFVSVAILNRKIFVSKQIIFAVLLFVITFTAQFLFDVRHQFQMTKAILDVAKGGEGGLGSAIPLNMRFPIRLNEFLSASVYSLGGQQLIGWVGFVIAAFGGFLTFSRKEKSFTKQLVFFLLVPLTIFICYFFYQRTAWSWYWIGLPIAYYFFLSFLLTQYLIDKLYRKVIAVILAVFFIYTANAYGIYKSWEGDTGTFKNMLTVVDYIYTDANGKPFGEFVYTPPVYDYAYQHLFWWRGETKYGYLPSKSKDGNFYLIVEPDKERPWAPNGWKETVIKTGKTIWINHMPGNIEVEKRTAEANPTSHH